MFIRLSILTAAFLLAPAYSVAPPAAHDLPRKVADGDWVAALQHELTTLNATDLQLPLRTLVSANKLSSEDMDTLAARLVELGLVKPGTQDFNSEVRRIFINLHLVEGCIENGTLKVSGVDKAPLFKNELACNPNSTEDQRTKGALDNLDTLSSALKKASSKASAAQTATAQAQDNAARPPLPVGTAGGLEEQESPSFNSSPVGVGDVRQQGVDLNGNGIPDNLEIDFRDVNGDGFDDRDLNQDGVVDAGER
ncbi:hypothetical protein K2X33_13135, partial [bacterium]|nr:hypothetical protein [bacterium]